MTEDPLEGTTAWLLQWHRQYGRGPPAGNIRADISASPSEGAHKASQIRCREAA